VGTLKFRRKRDPSLGPWSNPGAGANKWTLQGSEGAWRRLTGQRLDKPSYQEPLSSALPLHPTFPSSPGTRPGEPPRTPTPPPPSPPAHSTPSGDSFPRRQSDTACGPGARPYLGGHVPGTQAAPGLPRGWSREAVRGADSGSRWAGGFEADTGRCPRC
jgi:hypothetical protein